MEKRGEVETPRCGGEKWKGMRKEENSIGRRGEKN